MMFNKVNKSIIYRDPTLPALSQMNDEINQAKNRHKRDKWRMSVETLDHKSASSKLWRTIKALDGKSTQTAENETITFIGSQVWYGNNLFDITKYTIHYYKQYLIKITICLETTLGMQ